MLNSLLRFWKHRVSKNDPVSPFDVPDSQVPDLAYLNKLHPPARMDAYLEELIKLVAELEPKDADKYERVLDQLTDDAYRKGIALKSRARTKSILREATSAGSIKGLYIALMRSRALAYLREHPKYEELCKVPIAMLPTHLLNGQACLNPSYEPFILIDSGMMRNLTEIIHAYRGFFTWGWAEHAYCRDHSQIDFAQTIVMLTVVSLAGEPSLRSLCPALLARCPSVPENSERRVMIARIADIVRDFVLLHEYGHIALGHLDSRFTQELDLGPATVSANVTQPLQELEADAFAVQAIVSRRDKVAKGNSVDHLVAALGEPVGVFMRFLDLTEANVNKQGGRLGTSHPSAISRWRRIRAALTPSDVKNDFLSDVDDAFDTILEWYQLEPASTR